MSRTGVYDVKLTKNRKFFKNMVKALRKREHGK